VKHHNFDLMYNILFFSQIVFDKFITKGGEIVHKIGRTLVNRVVERRNMIMSKGRTCIESVRESLFRGSFVSFYVFELFLALICFFFLICRFSCHLLALRFFFF
jgi:hypothetical protein